MNTQEANTQKITFNEWSRKLVCTINEAEVVKGYQALMFQHLLHNEDKWVSNEQIVEDVWGVEYDEFLQRSADVHLSKLRKAIKPFGYVIKRARKEGLKLTRIKNSVNS